MDPSTTSRNSGALGRLGLLALLACLATPSALARGPMRGYVIRVTDGDTVWVQPAGGGTPRRLRLQGIDAPEICQAHGEAAREALMHKLLHRPVAVRGRRFDDYQRQLSRLATPELPDVGAWMVAEGHAWSYRYRGRLGPYAAEEAEARTARRGLWGEGRALEPRRFRQRHGSCHEDHPRNVDH